MEGANGRLQALRRPELTGCQKDIEQRCQACSRMVTDMNLKTGKLHSRCVRCRGRRRFYDERRKLLGLCCDCRGPSNGKARCLECNRRSKARLRARGCCANCGRGLDRPTSICHICALKGVAQKQLGDRALWIKLEEMLNRQDSRCALTGLPIEAGRGASLDHIIPTARGGTDDLSNLRFVHLVVNRMKSSLLDEEFLAWIEVLAWHAHQKGSFPAALKSPSEVTIQLALSIGIRPTTEKAGYGTFKRRP